MDKAAHLALLGFKPCSFMQRTTYRSDYRIKRQEKDDERMLQYNAGSWEVYTGADLAYYQPVEWDDVDVSDLPMELIQEFLYREHSP